MDKKTKEILVKGGYSLIVGGHGESPIHLNCPRRDYCDTVFFSSPLEEKEVVRHLEREGSILANRLYQLVKDAGTRKQPENILRHFKKNGLEIFANTEVYYPSPFVLDVEHPCKEYQNTILSANYNGTDFLYTITNNIRGFPIRDNIKMGKYITKDKDLWMPILERAEKEVIRNNAKKMRIA